MKQANGTHKQPLMWLRVLIVVATVVAVAITIFLGEQTFRETKRLATKEFNQQQLILARSAARGIESYFKELSTGLQSLAKMPSVRQMDPECVQCLKHTYWGFPTRTSLRLLDKDGVLRFVYPDHNWRNELIGRNYSKEAYFQEAAQNMHTGVHVITNERGETRIRVAVAIYSTPGTETIKPTGGTGVTSTQPSHSKPESGRFCGVLVGSLNPRMIAQDLVCPIVSGKTGYAWLLDDRGVFLAHYEKDFVGRSAFQVRTEKDPEILYHTIGEIQQKMLAGEEGLGRYSSGWHKDKTGEIEKLVAYTPVHVDSKIWSVAVCAPVSEVEEVIRASKRYEFYTLGFVILTLLTGGLIFFITSSRWSRSLERKVRNRTEQLRETSDYLNRLIRYANAPIVVWDPAGKITIFNKTFEKISGRSEVDVLGGPLDVLFPPQSRSESLEKIEVSKGQYWENVEIPILHKDGRVHIGLWNSANIYAEDGKTLIATVAQGQDITERKRAEERIEHLNAVLRAIRNVNQLIVREKDRGRLLQGACDNLIETRGYHNAWIVLLDKAGKFVTATEGGLGVRFKPMLGRLRNTELPPCGLKALKQSGVVVTADPLSECTSCSLSSVDSSGASMVVRLEHDGLIYGLLSVSIPAELAKDTEEHDLLIEVAGDIALALHDIELTRQHEQAEEALRESEQKFATMAENVPGILFRAIVHKDGSITLPYVSPSARKFGLYGAEEMSVRPELLQVVIHPDYHEQFKEMTVAASGKLEPVDWEVRLNTQFTNIEFIRVIARPQAMTDGNVAWDGLALDITERKRAEEAVRREKDKAQEYLDVAGVLLMAIDADQKIIRINKKGCEILGYEKEEELIGKHYFNNFIPERLRGEVLRVFKLLMAGEVEQAEYSENSVLTRSGEERILAWNNNVLRNEQGEIYAVLCSGEDISKRKQAEEETTKLEAQLRQAVKMEAIGRLAGGIAHDFNNMLAIIQGYADLLLKDMDADDRNRDDVARIRAASKRAAALTRQLLAFGRKQTIQPKVLDLNEIIADADSMLQRIIGEDIELETIPGKDLWHVKVDPDQIEEQIILNLAVNAREAMPDGGKLAIETANTHLDEDYARRHAEVTPGDYVMLAVSDTGVGMTREIMARIFEPFFTTKEVGKSSGLGLSTVYGIVKQSGGHIWVYSEPGKGTTFKIYLPRVDAPAEHLKHEYEPGVLPRGTETILMAEDEQSVLAINCRVLREQGYTVLEAPDGSEALRAAEKSAEGEIHLLITDVIMPHMSGKDLADRIKTVHPNIKVLFISGYTENAVVHHGVLDKGVNFLAKPFTSSQLFRTVRRILDTK